MKTALKTLKKKIFPVSIKEIQARMSDGSPVYEGYWAGQSETQVRQGIIRDYTRFYNAQGYKNFEIKFV